MPASFSHAVYVAFEASFTKELYHRLASTASAIDPGSSVVKMMCEKSSQRYDYVSKMAEAYGAKFVLLWQPMLWVETCQLPSGLRKSEGGTMGRLANRRGLRVLRSNRWLSRGIGNDFEKVNHISEPAQRTCDG